MTSPLLVYPLLQDSIRNYSSKLVHTQSLAKATFPGIFCFLQIKMTIITNFPKGPEITLELAVKEKRFSSHTERKC